ncbi:MAG: hypothetical protein Kow0059_02210 [Candidatus Sumerlaeia bacterium]
MIAPVEACTPIHEPHASGRRLPTRRELNAHPARKLIHRGRSLAQGDIWLVPWPTGPLAVKDIGSRPLWWRRLAGRRALAHEARILKRLQGMAGVPRYFGMIDRDALAMEWMEGGRLPHRRHNDLTVEFFTRLKAIVREMHQRGVAHGDLRRKNILAGPDGRPCILDYTTSACVHTGLIRPLKRLIFRHMVLVDWFNILKIQSGYRPESLTPDEKRLLERPPLLLRLGRWIRQNIYRPFKRLRER